MALVLRTQIEEIGAMLAASDLLRWQSGAEVDSELAYRCVQTVRSRILPRTQTKTPQELVNPAVATSADRSELLQKTFDALGDYVHPNYGSHVLLIRPNSPEAASLIVGAFVAVYDAFFELPWAGDVVPDRGPRTDFGAQRSNWKTLADETAPSLSGSLPESFHTAAWSKALSVFDHAATLEDQLALDELHASEYLECLLEPTHKLVSLFGTGQRRDAYLPVPIHSAGQRLKFSMIVRSEQDLNEQAASLRRAVDAAQVDKVILLKSAVAFALQMAEFKIDILASEAAAMLNRHNVIGAALLLRSMLEHHAVAIHLASKLEKLRVQMENSATPDETIERSLADAEKEVARLLAGTPSSSEAISKWQEIWKGSVGMYHILDAIRSLERQEPGYLQCYGWLSHIVHGSACTGGDLLGLGGMLAQKPTLAQIIVFLSQLISTDAALDRQAALILYSSRLATGGKSMAEHLLTIRIEPGRKLKKGREVFGRGTEDEPFRFRQGLIYHQAFYHWLHQEKLEAQCREPHIFPTGIGDRVLLQDGSIIFFCDPHEAEDR